LHKAFIAHGAWLQAQNNWRLEMQNAMKQKEESLREFELVSLSHSLIHAARRHVCVRSHARARANARVSGCFM
jgi:hypothetical protein